LRWDEVMLLVHEYLAQHFPHQKVNFLMHVHASLDKLSQYPLLN
jgi:hypothetical protein